MNDADTDADTGMKKLSRDPYDIFFRVGYFNISKPFAFDADLDHEILTTAEQKHS